MRLLLFLQRKLEPTKVLHWIREVSMLIASVVGRRSKYGQNKKKLMSNANGSRILPGPNYCDPKY